MFEFWTYTVHEQSTRIFPLSNNSSIICQSSGFVWNSRWEFVSLRKSFWYLCNIIKKLSSKNLESKLYELYSRIKLQWIYRYLLLTFSRCPRGLGDTKPQLKRIRSHLCASRDSAAWPETMNSEMYRKIGWILHEKNIYVTQELLFDLNEWYIQTKIMTHILRCAFVVEKILYCQRSSNVADRYIDKRILHIFLWVCLST